jgi:threonine dehydrogenase-like Zn-dependent dehydrogenase
MKDRKMAKVLFTDKEKKVVIEDVELAATGENQVRVKTAYSYISAGTELTMLQMGNVNMVREVGHQQLGYTLSGYVSEVGTNVTHIKVGDPVACVGQGAFHADEVLVAKNLVIPVPEGCPIREAAMSAMGCFALEGIRKAELEFGENVLVIGGGLMGQFASQYAAMFAGKVILLENNPERLNKVVDNVTALASDEQVWDKIKELTAPVGVEKVLFCLGGDRTNIFDEVKKVMNTSPDNIAQGTIVFCGGATITIDLASRSGNLKILSSAKAGPGYRDAAFESGADYPMGYVKWTVNRNVQAILNAIAAGKLKLDHLITHEYHYTDALAAYQELAKPDTDAMAVLLKYS